jgi:hypothetical protein
MKSIYIYMQAEIVGVKFINARIVCMFTVVCLIKDILVVVDVSSIHVSVVS